MISYTCFIGIVAIIFSILAYFIPSKNRPENIHKYDLSILHRKFRSIKILSYIITLLLLLSVVFILTQMMLAVQKYYLESLNIKAIFVDGVSWGAFVIPSMFLGIVLLNKPMDLIITFLGRFLINTNKEEWEVFKYDWNKDISYGYDIDIQKLSKILLIVIVPICVIMFILGIMNYTIITENYIAENRYFSLNEKKFQFSEIRKILYINKYKHGVSGKIENSDNKYYLIITNDGYQWSTLDYSFNQTNEEKHILKYIVEKSKIQIIEGIHGVDDTE